MLFIDLSSVFNTVSPLKLVLKLKQLSISTFHCNWTMNFLKTDDVSWTIKSKWTISPFLVSTSGAVSSIGVSQGCILSLYFQQQKMKEVIVDFRQAKN